MFDINTGVFDAYPWLLALGIFFARVADVSIGTIRTIVVIRGYRALAASIGFIEVLIWIMAAAQVFTHLDAWYLAVAYAAGFATGTYVGMWLETLFAIGRELIRCISYDNSIDLADVLHKAGFNVFSVACDRGDHQPVELIFAVEKRRRVPELLELIKRSDPKAIYSVTDVKTVYEGPPAYIAARSFSDLLWRARSKRR